MSCLLADSEPSECSRFCGPGGSLGNEVETGSRSLIQPDKNDWAPRIGFRGLSGDGASRLRADTASLPTQVFGSSDRGRCSRRKSPFFLDRSIIVAELSKHHTGLPFLKNGFPVSQFGTTFVDLTKVTDPCRDPQSADALCATSECQPRFS